MTPSTRWSWPTGSWCWRAGGVTQAGTTADVARHPRSPYVAQLVGLNLLHGSAGGDRTVRLAGGTELVVADPVPAVEVAVAVRPQAVTVHRTEPEGSARNTWPAVVAELEADHDRVRVALEAIPVPGPRSDTGPGLLDGAHDTIVAEVTAAAVADLDLTLGTPVWASVKAVDLTVYER